MKGWVYFARLGDDGPIKIGRACDPRERVASLASCTPASITLLGAMFCEHADVEEKAIHEKLAAHRVKGEWFDAAAASNEMSLLASRLLLPEQISALEPEDLWARTERIELRLTPEEHAAWKEAARRENLSLSEWIRTMANEGVVEEGCSP